MHFGTVLFLGIAVNLDNLCLGLSCGIAKKHIPWYHNLIIAAVTGVFGSVSCAAAYLIPRRFSQISASLGALILFCTGVWTIIQGITKRDAVPDCACRFTSLREICILSVALALNCLIVSFGMGMSHAPILLLGLSMAAFSFIAVSIGNHMGKRVASILKSNWLDVLSGLLLVVIAVWERFV